MTEAVVAVAAPRRFSGEGVLNAAASLWFFVTLIGQGVFLYYIAAFYGPAALSGDFASWNRHPMLDPITSDVGGNIAFGAHVALAAIIVFAGMLQLVPQIRTRAAPLHRWNGRVFISVAMLASLAGLYMVWIRGGATGGIINDLTITGNALLVFACGALAWRAGAARDITSHRRWALRTFMVANGVFFLRLGFSAWIVLTRAEPNTLTFHIFAAASYLLPLALLEIYLRAKDGGALAKSAAAAIVFASAAYMSLGVFGFYMIFVQHILGAA